MSESDSFCVKCGTKLDPNNNFCPKCGNSILENSPNKETIRIRPIKQKKSSRLWYILPIILGIIGGIIGYFVLRKNDPILAKKSLILGIGLGAIGLGMSIQSYALELPAIFAGQYTILALLIVVIGGIICYGAYRFGKKELEETNSKDENYK